VELGRHEVAVLCPPAVVDAGLDVRVDNVGRDAACVINKELINNQTLSEFKNK